MAKLSRVHIMPYPSYAKTVIPFLTSARAISPMDFEMLFCVTGKMAEGSQAVCFKKALQSCKAACLLAVESTPAYEQ